MRPRGAAPSLGMALEERVPELVAAWRGREGRSRGYRAAPLSDAELDRVGSALFRLQRGLTGKRILAGAPYMDDPDLLGAYLLYYWPVSYLQTSLAIAEIGFRSGRALDLGSGPGPAAAAALDAGATHVDLADSSDMALELASHALSTRSDRIRLSRVDLESPDALADATGPYDLIILGHCLNELWRGRADRVEKRADLLSRAATLMAPGGKLLVIEPALLETSRELLEVRDALAASGHSIAGPCPKARDAHYPCPALASGPDRTCHADAPWNPPEPIASLAERAGLDRRSVKFAWFAIGSDARSNDGVSVDEELADDWAIHGRVISDPMLNKAGRVRYVLCSEGGLVTISAPKNSIDARRSGFLSLARGDVLHVYKPERREGGFGLGPDSRLKIVAAAPKIEP